MEVKDINQKKKQNFFFSWYQRLSMALTLVKYTFTVKKAYHKTKLDRSQVDLNRIQMCFRILIELVYQP